METGICILAKHTICIHGWDLKMEYQAFHIDNSTPPGIAGAQTLLGWKPQISDDK